MEHAVPYNVKTGISLYLFSFFYSFLMIVLVTGCGSGGGGNPVSPGTPGGGAINFSSLIPAPLVKYLGAGSKLSASVIADNKAPLDLSVDGIAGEVAGIIPDIPDGSHEFEVIYYVEDGAGKKVEVMRGSRTVIATAGSAVNLEYGPKDLRYADTDSDGFTNLAELGSGTGWDDINSRPVAEIPRSSPNYVLSDSAAGSPEGKTTVVGESSSANYTLR